MDLSKFALYISADVCKFSMQLHEITIEKLFLQGADVMKGTTTMLWTVAHTKSKFSQVPLEIS